MFIAWVMLALAPWVSWMPVSVRDQWDFKFKKFVIGAWWGPSATDAELKLYREAGFNVVMAGRYMELDRYGDPSRGALELNLAHKYGLGVLFDTYTRNDRPWGGVVTGGWDPHPVHHAATLPELKWLYERIGKHPALVGFMIGDDQGEVTPRTDACTQFLHSLPKPHLFPWLCGWIPPEDLARHGNPICDPQIYPTLYNWKASAEDLARAYAAAYFTDSRKCLQYGVMFWPMFNVSSPEASPDPHSIAAPLPSDSLVRFPAYAAVAYGATGIFYFCYSGGAIERVGPWNTPKEARAALTNLYPVVQRINRRIAAWGPRVLQTASTGLFGTAFSAKTPAAGSASPEGLQRPGPGRLIDAMSSDLLAGVLVGKGRPPLVMVVDCRTSKRFGDLPEREVILRFHPSVSSVKVLEGRKARLLDGSLVSLHIEAGGGQLLELHGRNLERLCTQAAIYGPPVVAGAAGIPTKSAPRTSAQDVTVVVDPGRVEIPYWTGFGCSLSWWAVFSRNWPSASRLEACRRLFGRGEGCLGLNVVRYNAGGTAPTADPSRYRPGACVLATLDADGSFHPERDGAQIECLRLAHRLGADTFELFANSPPYWMLKNGDTRGGENGSENLKPECEQDYARWLATVAERVEGAAGVHFRSIEPFNEPSAWWWDNARSNQEGCRILPSAQARILKYLRLELKRTGVTHIIACSDENDAHTAFTTLEFLTDPNGGGLDAGTIGQVNVHGYFPSDWRQRLRRLAAAHSVRHIWMSEVSFREWGHAGYIPQDMRCALPQTRALLADLKRLRPEAWVFWQPVEPLELCLDNRFTYGLLQSPAQRRVQWQGKVIEPGELVISKAFWALLQFSHFIRPGCRFVSASDEGVVAAVDGGGRRVVLVVQNDGLEGRRMRFDLSRFRRLPRMARRWRTMDDGGGHVWNCRPLEPLELHGRGLTDDVPPHSITTYVLG
ncbi:MAG: glycoside hydrolase [Chthonomonadales bacterium]